YKTTLTYKTTFNMLLKYLGDIQLIDLTHKKIEEYIQFQIRTNSIHSGRKDLINIKASLNWAVQNNYLLENPSKSIKRIIPPQKLPLYYTREDFQKLLDVIDKEDVKDLVIFAVNTGLRQSELLNLQFRQVNFSNRTIILDNQTHITKSKRIRSVPLNETAFNIIQKRNNGREQNVFTIRESGIKQDWIVHNFKKYVLKAKVNPKLHFHSLRHTFASWLVQKGISIYEVSKLLGHADIKTTEIYAHLRSDDLRNAVRVLD
ncbi:MAG: tyrosine-type recombinase/integrase, partial [Ignavibacteriaceae bacterium]